MATQRKEPALVRALRTALVARQPRIDAAMLPSLLFVEAVVACDAAARRYREAIETALTPNDARELLATATTFRARVRDVRLSTGAEIAALFTRCGLEPVEIDPLDLATPRVWGLSHVDIVRLADLSDRARARFDSLRAQANDRIAPLLNDITRQVLTDAKRTRLGAFFGAMHAELTPLGSTVERFSDTTEALAALADRWY